jgi:hypothetical protein
MAESAYDIIKGLEPVFNSCITGKYAAKFLNEANRVLEKHSLFIALYGDRGLVVEVNKKVEKYG